MSSRIEISKIFESEDFCYKFSDNLLQITTQYTNSDFQNTIKKIEIDKLEKLREHLSIQLLEEHKIQTKLTLIKRIKKRANISLSSDIYTLALCIKDNLVSEDINSIFTLVKPFDLFHNTNHSMTDMRTDQGQQEGFQEIVRKCMEEVMNASNAQMIQEIKSERNKERQNLQFTKTKPRVCIKENN